MRELPILACDSVARNLWNGMQTQHRVPCKNLEFGSDVTSKDILGYDDGYLQVANMWIHGHPAVVQYVKVKAPWSVGDILYVREACCIPSEVVPFNHPAYHYDVIYRADGGKMHFTIGSNWVQNNHEFKWTPNIHARKILSRTRLEVTRVWCERAQDISEADAQSEGCERPIIGEQNPQIGGFPVHPYTGYYRDAFRDLWDSLYGKKHPWASNPWVWACEFKRIDQ